MNIDRLFTTPDAATATILGDNYQIGVLAADYISEQLNCQGNVVEIQGLAGISVTTDRTKGFTDELKKVCPDGGIKIVASQPGDFNPDTGLQRDGEHPPGPADRSTPCTRTTTTWRRASCRRSATPAARTRCS